MSKVTIKLERESRYADKLRGYKIILDGEAIGDIFDGESKVFEVEGGEHTLLLKIDWARSNMVRFTANDNEKIIFRCANRAKGFRVIFAIIYGTVLSQRYIKLERVK